MMETGHYSTIDELAAAEKINTSYVSRLLRLTLLAPDIIEAILDGRQPAGMTLPGLMQPFPMAWGRQPGGQPGPFRPLSNPSADSTFMANTIDALRGLRRCDGNSEILGGQCNRLLLSCDASLAEDIVAYEAPRQSILWQWRRGGPTAV